MISVRIIAAGKSDIANGLFRFVLLFIIVVNDGFQFFQKIR